LTEFIASYGVWVVAAFIALETIGLPFPAEAALIAAGFFAARTQAFHITWLITVGILAAIVGNVAGFWIGKRFGHELLVRYGARFGLTQERIKIGQWLFLRYGGSFVFAARFLPFLRNMAAVLAGTNRMPSLTFYLASGMAAVAWVVLYAWGAHSFGAAFDDIASPAAIVLAVVAVAILIGIPLLIRRYEKRLLAKAER
jgi:membrane protein DedA with SNARE-associated domain